MWCERCECGEWSVCVFVCVRECVCVCVCERECVSECVCGVRESV